MKSMPVGELKARFREVILAVRRGEEIVVSFGKKKENVAVIVPYARYKRHDGIKLGLLQGKVTCAFAPDYKMTPDELVEE